MRGLLQQALGQFAGGTGIWGIAVGADFIGEGLVDQKACLAAMQQAGYAGYINIEYEGNAYPPDEATRKAAAYLQGLMRELGTAS